jgi:hypothetical protein
LKDHRSIESTDVTLIIAIVILVAYGTYRMLGTNIAAFVAALPDRSDPFSSCVLLESLAVAAPQITIAVKAWYQLYLL